MQVVFVVDDRGCGCCRGGGRARTLGFSLFPMCSSPTIVVLQGVAVEKGVEGVLAQSLSLGFTTAVRAGRQALCSRVHCHRRRADIFERRRRFAPRTGLGSLVAAGRPELIVAPMRDNSELPFRMLCWKYGTAAAYTPMLHSHIFTENKKYRSHNFF